MFTVVVIVVVVVVVVVVVNDDDDDDDFSGERGIREGVMDQQRSTSEATCATSTLASRTRVESGRRRRQSRLWTQHVHRPRQLLRRATCLDGRPRLLDQDLWNDDSYVARPRRQ